MDVPHKSRPYWIAVGLCLPVGVAAILAIEALADMKALDLDSLIALFSGLFVLLMGVMVFATSLSPKSGMSRSQAVLAGLTLVGSAVVLMVPPMAPASIDPRVMFGLFLGVLALSYLPPLLARRRSDEMDRRVTAESSLVGYHLFGLAVMLHAAASAFGLEPPIDLWALVAVMTVVQLFVSTILTARRVAPLPRE